MRKITFLKMMLVAIALIVGSTSAFAQVVISQVYGGGGNSGATYKNDFIELYNRGTSPVSLNGWSVQYTSATGATWTNQTNLPNVTLNPGYYYLIQEAAGTGVATALPTPDATGTINLSGTAGKVALCNNTIALTSASFTSTSPTGSSIVDFVGFGTTANNYEGTGSTPAPSNTTSILRNSGGLVDTNDNSKDFTTGNPTPRNTSNFQSTESSAPVTFSVPATGSYFSTQNVTLSSITSGAKIYYTLDSSDPSASGTRVLYTTAIAVTTTTTIKAIAYNASDANPSGITNVVLTFPTFTTVADIATLRAGLQDGTIYKLISQPLLTFQDAVGKVKFIQDATAGIVIYDNSAKITTTYTIGDKLSNLYCTLQTYNGMLEIIPSADPGAAVSSGNPVTPATATLATIGNYIGQLVTVKNLKITGSGNFASATAYVINDGTAGVLRTAYSDLPYITTPTAIPTANQDITGVVNMYSSTEVDLIPRTAADFNETIFTTISTGSGIWSSSSSWTSNSVPTSNSKVVVNNDLTIDQDATVNNLTINSGAKLTLNTGRTLTATTFNINSDASGTGTFIDNGTTTISGTATVNQNLSSYRTWYLSSPVSSATPSGMDRIKYYDETTNTWSSPVTTMNEKIGYLVVPNSGVTNIQFSGSLNTGDKTITLTRSASNTSKPGFNLIGNPYPSYLDWSKVLTTANAAVMPTTTMWYRTKDGSAYKFWTVNGDGISCPNGASQYIPPMQAFWVRTNANNSSLNLTNDMRSHAPGTDYLLKSPAVKNTERTLLRLQVSNDTNTDEALIYFSANAANGLDVYDSPKMSNEDVTIPEIFTRMGSEQLVINAMNSIPLNQEIALGFVASNATSFSIKANEVRNLPADLKVILKDNVTKAETDLTNGTTVYSFSPLTTTGDRFSVIFRSASATTGLDNQSAKQVQVYSNAKNQLTVLYKDAVNDASFVSVYNTMGQRLINQRLNGSSTVLNGTFPAGVYIVNVNNVTRKVVVE